MTHRKHVRAAVVGVAAIAAMVLAACGATTTNPNAASSNAAPSSSAAPSSAPSAGASTQSEAGSSSAAAPSQSAGSSAPSSAAGTDESVATSGDVTPLDLHLPADPALAAKVPENLKKAGKIVIVSDPTYPPIVFRANGTGPMVGSDVDLGTAVAEILGLKADWTNISFDGILAGVAAGRFDMSFAAISVTPEREKQVDFVTYYQAGVSIMVRAGNPEHINNYLDLCGKTVGAQNGTTENFMLTDPTVDLSIVAACKKANKPPVNAKGYPLQTDVNAALAGGRIDAYLADTPVVLYAVKLTGDRFEKVGQDEGVAQYGVAIPKSSAALAPLVQQAMQKLMDSGDYTKILTHWGLQDGGITKAVLNPQVQG